MQRSSASRSVTMETVRLPMRGHWGWELLHPVIKASAPNGAENKPHTHPIISTCVCAGWAHYHHLNNNNGNQYRLSSLQCRLACALCRFAVKSHTVTALPFWARLRPCSNFLHIHTHSTATKTEKGWSQEKQANDRAKHLPCCAL